MVPTGHWVQVADSGRAVCLPFLSAARKPRCDASSGAAVALWRTTVWEHCLWVSGHLHCKEPAVQPGQAFPHQWCSRVRKASGPITWSCADACKGRQCPKPGWSSQCCCDAACWLALPCVAGSSSSLVLCSSAGANALFRCIPSAKLGMRVIRRTQAVYTPWTHQAVRSRLASETT